MSWAESFSGPHVTHVMGMSGVRGPVAGMTRWASLIEQDMMAISRGGITLPPRAEYALCPQLVNHRSGQIVRPLTVDLTMGIFAETASADRKLQTIGLMRSHHADKRICPFERAQCANAKTQTAPTISPSFTRWQQTASWLVPRICLSASFGPFHAATPGGSTRSLAPLRRSRTRNLRALTPSTQNAKKTRG
jgi:hypothetical protein